MSLGVAFEVCNPEADSTSKQSGNGSTKVARQLHSCIWVLFDLEEGAGCAEKAKLSLHKNQPDHSWDLIDP